MTKKEKTTGQPSKEGRLGRRKSKLGTPSTGFVSSLDLAVLGAVLALTSGKVGSASADGVVLQPAEGAGIATSESFGRAVHALSGASAEVMVLAALAENMHRDLARSLRESTFSSPVISSDAAPFDWSLDPTQPRSLKNAPVLEVVPNEVGPDELVATKDATSQDELNKQVAAERSYVENIEGMQKAAQELLGVMREMFGQEADSVEARQVPQDDGATDSTRTEVAEEDVGPIEEVVIVANDSSGGGPPFG